MGGLFRCENMKYIQLVLDEESARETIQALGEFRMLHIEDHGAPERRLYKDNKRRILECISWQRKLQDFRDVMVRNDVEPPGPEIEAGAWSPAGDTLEQIQRYFDQLEKDLIVQINFKVEEILELNMQLERKFCIMKALRDMRMEATDGNMRLSEQKYDANSLEQGLLLEGGITTTINGTIPIRNQTLFERLVYRVAKGHNNALLGFEPIVETKEQFSDPLTGNPVEKCLFTVVVIGSELPRRIRKIGSLFGATIFDLPGTREDLEEEIKQIKHSREDGKKILNETISRIRKILTSLARNNAGGSPLVQWERTIQREQAVCDCLQKFYIVEDDTSIEKKGIGGRIAAKCWIPEESFNALKQVLRKPKAPMAMCTPLNARGRMPPTYFKTNIFTGSYQEIVDTYGIADYKEANPGLFTIITFPFLFGIMYGDIFHGSMLTIFAITMIYNEKAGLRQIKLGQMNEMLSMAFSGRYIILLMGIFAVYCGTIYNDCASIPFNIFGTVYTSQTTDPVTNITTLHQDGSRVYPWGIDPEWSHRANSLTFVNSFKMKMAVTIGVIQMSFGILLGLSNDCFFKDKLSIIFEFIPRILFMLCTFGYMIFMIVYKMCIDWTGKKPPNIIQTMIKMFLSPGHYPDDYLYDRDLQVYLQTVLFIIAIATIPLMLFPKAFIKQIIWKRRFGHLHQQSHLRSRAGGEGQGILLKDLEHDDNEHHDHRNVGPNFQLSDELINTGIHTIEFILGCVSNTASYLRLWALSLAHAELSEVFWDKMVMEWGLLNFPIGFAGVAVWCGATFGVLLLMDVLECFLHALRLHWVEFQNKFYHGEGYKFSPFKFEEN